MLFGKLSWGKEMVIKNMGLKKEQLTNSEKPLIPEFLKQLLFYVRTLEFDECPDYDEIIKVFDTVYKDISGAESFAESGAEGLEDLDADD